MRVLGCCTVLVAALAALVGSLYSGLLVRLGAFQWIDSWDPKGRGTRFRGETPWLVPKPWPFSEEDIPRLDGQVIIVTGGNAGLGYWTARHLAAKGATVVLACRSSAKCQAAAEEIAAACPAPGCADRLLPRPLDLSKLESVVAFASEFLAEHARLDSLVLNAGIMPLSWHLTEAGLESTMATNHVGHHLLTKLLLPELESTASKHGVATVSVHSSAAHYDVLYEGGIRMDLLSSHPAQSGSRPTEQPEWYSGFEAYCESKLANCLFAQELAERELGAGHNVLVNVHAPGAVKTNIADGIVGPGGLLDQRAGPAGPFLREAIVWLLEQIVWHPRQASLTQVYTAVAEEIRGKKTTGRYFQSVAREQLPDPHCRNTTLRKLVWDATERIVAGASSAGS